MPSTVRIGLIASFLLLFTVNIVMLDIIVFSTRRVTSSQVAETTVRVAPSPDVPESCSLSCETKIDALAEKVDALIASEPTVVSSSPSFTSRSAKEYYITLGSGVIKTNTWQDVAGAEAVVDTANYPPIKSVTFEVYLKIPTANGKVYAKLYNVTDKHDVWFSEVASEGPTLTKKEAAITLEQGAKTYRVMGLSTLKYDANIENARLRIITY